MKVNAFYIPPGLIYDRVNFRDEWTLIVSFEREQAYHRKKVIEVVNQEIWIETGRDVVTIQADDCQFLKPKMIQCPPMPIILN